MRIVHVEDVPLEKRTSGGRAGTWERRRIMSGDTTSAGNFSLIIYYHDGSFYSPRHHHNFDQFRYQIEGKSEFDRNGKMSPGVLGYFPEGAYYGPTSGPAHTVAVLQFGGPSGLGFMGERSKGAAAELSKFGTFEKGVYRRNEGIEGKRNQDSYEAIWEYVNQRPIAYPGSQYAAPIMMDTNNVPWTPIPGVEGVEERALGVFTHCKLVAASYRLMPSSSFHVSERGIYLIRSGSGTVAEESYGPLTIVYLDEGETVLFTATETTEIVLMGMSRVSRMATSAYAPEAAAAE